MKDLKTSLRELWTEQGVSIERQNEVLAEISAKAEPGARVGPFIIPDRAEIRRETPAPKIRQHWETHLYTYAHACRPCSRWSIEDREILRAKCLRHGHTEGECLLVEKNPDHFIRTGRLAP